MEQNKKEMDSEYPGSEMEDTAGNKWLTYSCRMKQASHRSMKVEKTRLMGNGMFPYSECY